MTRRSAQFLSNLLLLPLVVAGLAQNLPAQSAYPVLSSYQLPSGQYATSNIVSGPNGSLWFLTANYYGSDPHVVSLATSGVATSYSLAVLARTSSPIGKSICVGPNGLYFLAGSGSSAVLANVTTNGTVSSVPITGGTAFTSGPGAITADPDNNLWFTDGTNPQVWKYTVNASTPAFATFPLASPGFGITAGPAGNVWLTEYAITNNGDSGSSWSGKVAQVTTAGAVTEYALPQQNVSIYSSSESPLDTFTTGPDGALWFTEYDGSMIGRVTVAGAVTTVYTGEANGITNGNDGNLWFTQPYNDDASLPAAIVRLTTAGTPTVYPVNTNQSSQFFTPLGIAVGTDAALWYNDSSTSYVGRAILAPVIATPSLPGGTYGAAYSATLSGYGGLMPYTWTWTAATSSSLPPGLSLSTTGIISGTPTATGTFTVNVVLTDSQSTPANVTRQFTLAVLAGAPSGISSSSGSGQSAAVNTAFPNPLIAKVTDSGGNPLPNISVTFTAPGAGAGATFNGFGTTATVTTNSAGLATSPALTANSTAGGYTINANANGVLAAAPFTLTNTAGAAASVTATSGFGQTAPINSAFANPLVATVKDSGGNPVANVTVTFSAPASGPSATFAGGVISATATTNASGVATSPALTANGSAGGYTIVANTSGVSAAPFALTNTAGAAATITATSGFGQTAQISSGFTSPLVATVKDSGGNPVPSVSVTFSAPASGPSATFAGGVTSVAATTNASGVATSPALTANGSAGGYTIVANTSGVSAAAPFALTNTAGAAATITATSGGGQRAPIGSAFPSPLVATVTDSGGNPVSNVTVTFTAPATGPSGTFAGGAATATPTTGANGVATSPAFTANSTAGSYSVIAAVNGVNSPATFTLSNNGPASISASSGTPQSAQIKSTFSIPLVAIVKDAFGNPLPNVSVVFTAPSSNASGSFSGPTTVSTDRFGIASSPAFTANSTAGSYNVSAAVLGVATPALFSLTNTAGPAATITAAASQSAQVGTAFTSPLIATVKDSGGNPVSNVTVTFTAPAQGASGTFASGALSVTATTNSGGAATSSTFTANSIAGGPYNVTASVQNVTSSAAFTLTNVVGLPASVTATAGSGQTAQVNTQFSTALTATVKDSFGNVVPRVLVVFTIAGSGASGTFNGASRASTQTDSAGLAVSPNIIANSTAGSFTVTASVTGVSGSASFTLTNSAGAPGSITVTSGSPQTAQASKAFANPLVATVTDSNHNPVPNATVTFTAPSSGASGIFAGGGISITATTNTSGVATSPVFTANNTAGSYSVVASVSGAATPVSFALTNTAGTPATVSVSSGSGQSARVNSAFNNALTVTVKDAGGNPVNNVTVTFTTPSSGAGGTFPGGAATATVQTNSAGVAASPTLTANGVTGSYTGSAKVAGISASADFNLTNVSGLTVTTTALPAGTAGLQYSQILATAAGTGPYHWSITKGTLPQGLTLNATTGDITGIPTATGTYSFTVSVTDSSAPSQTAVSQSLFIFVNPPASTGVVPVFTISGVPATTTPGASISSATVQLNQPSALAYSGTLSLTVAPNSAVAGLPEGYTGDAGFVGAGGAKSTTATVSIPAGTTSVAIPAFDPGTVAATITVDLVVGNASSTPAVLNVPTAAPTIEANSVQIVDVTSTGFSVELVATSSTRDLKNATFTFSAASGASISGTSSFTVDVSSILSTWFTTNTSYQYGGAFSLTIPFTLNGPSSAIQSVSVAVSNSVGTSSAVSGTQ